MIANQIQNPKPQSSKAQRVSGLAEYIAAPENTQGTEKCLYFASRGFVCEDFPSQQAEMIALAMEAIRSRDTIEHIVLSWPQEERPSPVQVDQAVDILMQQLGMAQHQCFYGLHEDTDNFHVHVELNRVDPLTGKAQHIAFAHEEILKAVARIEAAQGWRPERHARYQVQEDTVVRTADPQCGPVRKPGRIRDQEIRTGEKSALTLAQERVPELAKAAATWQDFHQSLADQGMAYQLRGAGAILLVGEVPAKASDVQRSLGLKSLEKRWGAFEAPQPSIEKQAPPPPEPLHETARVLGFSDYAQARREHADQRKKAKAAMDQRIAAEREALYQKQVDERRKALNGNWKGRGTELNVLRSVIAAGQAQEKAALLEQHKDLRKAFREQNPALFTSFEDWVRQIHGPEAATRYRLQDIPEIRPEAPDRTSLPEPRDIRDYHAVPRGREVLYQDRHGHTAFVDTGPKIVLLDRGDASVLAALQLAQQRYGKQLTLHGDNRFQEQAIRLAVEQGIAIANPELQPQILVARQRLAEERKCAAIQHPLPETPTTTGEKVQSLRKAQEVPSRPKSGHSTPGDDWGPG